MAALHIHGGSHEHAYPYLRRRVRRGDRLCRAVVGPADLPPRRWRASTPSATAPTLHEIAPGAGQHGYPYDAVPATPAIAGAPSINLAALGYVEREFTMTGGAKVYRQSGFWSSNGRWGASVAQASVPYTTRLLVRYPTSRRSSTGPSWSSG